MKTFYCVVDSVSVEQEGSPYTFTTFHLPRRNSRKLTRVSIVSDTRIARKTPVGPIPCRIARNQARGAWKSQKQNTLMMVGTMVFPAPLKAFVSTIPIP